MDEFARRGDRIYRREILPSLGRRSRGNVVAIDIETGAWEIGVDTLEASDRLLARVPDAQIWFVRVGYPAVDRIGPRVTRGSA